LDEARKKTTSFLLAVLSPRTKIEGYMELKVGRDLPKTYEHNTTIRVEGFRRVCYSC